MKQQMCSRCGERPAVVFIQKMENDKVTPEGLCIKCARELNIGSINQMIDKLGISDEEIEAASEQMADFMERYKESGCKIRVWTVNDAQDMRFFIQNELEAVITNYPDEALKIRDDMQKKERK